MLVFCVGYLILRTPRMSITQVHVCCWFLYIYIYYHSTCPPACHRSPDNAQDLEDSIIANRRTLDDRCALLQEVRGAGVGVCVCGTSYKVWEV